MAVKYDFVVEMEDGTTYDVTVDQRDIARFEVQPFAGNPASMMHTFYRFTAFSALDRAGALKNGKANMGWEAFNKQCVEVRDANPNQGEAPKE